jgi:hypothetical protein
MFNENERPIKIVYSYQGDDEEDDKYFEECYYKELEIFDKYDKYLYVKIYVDTADKKLIDLYDKNIEEHNRNMETNLTFPLLSPYDIEYEKEESSCTLSFDVFCYCEKISDYNTHQYNTTTKYDLVPNQGIRSLKGTNRYIIRYDSDYKGHLVGNIHFPSTYNMEKDESSNQESKLVCKYEEVYSLSDIEHFPIYVERVKSFEEFYTKKVRLVNDY